MEIWKKIEDYEGLYEVSNLGRVRDKNKRIKPMNKNNKGYFLLSLYYNGKTCHPSIHRLVAKEFIPNPNNYPQVNHIDCDKSNNTVDNLEWCTQRHNYNEGMKTFQYSKNENHYFSKLSNSDIPMIYELYKLGFTRATVSRIFRINSSSLEAIEKGISYRELGIDFSTIVLTKYKDLPNIKLPSYVRDYFKDNTVLNTLISEGKVSV
jgi:hypothetical protein